MTSQTYWKDVTTYSEFHDGETLHFKLVIFVSEHFSYNISFKIKKFETLAFGIENF